MEYIVTRAFREGEVDLKPGDTVDAGLWPNAELLVRQRYLKAAEPQASSTSTQPPAKGPRRT